MMQIQLEPITVTHSSTNWVPCRTNTLIETNVLPLCQTATASVKCNGHIQVCIPACRLHCVLVVDVNRTVMVVLQVFHLYLLLGVQDLLRLWIHVASVSYSHRCHRLRYHRLHLLLAKRRGLSMVCVKIQHYVI